MRVHTLKQNIGVSYRVSVVSIIVLLVSLSSFAHAAAYGNGYSYRRTVTIDHTKVANSDQADFPVLISGTYPFLARAANGGAVQNSSGYDIIFTADAAGQNKLDHEIDNYDPNTGKASFWVRIPALSHTSDTAFYIFYGNAVVTSSQENRSGVWSNGYVGVWHFGTAGMLSAADSSGQGNNGAGCSVTSDTGMTGGSATFGGSTGSYMGVPDSPSLRLARQVSISGWIKLDGAAFSGWAGIVRKGAIGGDRPNNYMLQGVSGSGRVELAYSHASNSNDYLDSVSSLSANSWSYVVGVIDTLAGRKSLYLNGVRDSSGTVSTESISTAADPLWLGKRSDTGFKGSLDEMHVSAVARSDDWIATEYNNQSSPATFYSVENEQVVGMPLAVSTVALQNGTINVPYGVTLLAQGGSSPYTWSVTNGALPAGLVLNSGTGILSGTPEAAGTSSFGVQVTDGNLSTANQSLTLTIAPILTITTGSLPWGKQNLAYNATLAGGGGVPPYKWSISAGSLPPGLSLDTSSGAITGAPTSTGTSTFNVQLRDANSSIVAQPLTIKVYAPLVLTTSSLTTGTQGTAYSATLGISGGAAPYSWSLTTGALPAGLSLNSSTGVLAGTPTEPGTNSFGIRVRDANGEYADATFSLSVTPPLAITSTSLADTVQGSSYAATLAATGGVQPYSWSVSSGYLPSGLSLNSATGNITGAALSIGVSTFTVKATDANGNTASQNLNITVNQPAPLRVTDSNGNVTTYTPRIAGGKWYVSDVSGTGCSSCTLSTDLHKVFDASGNVISATDALGHTTTYTYDAAGNTTTISTQLDTTVAKTSYTYNSFGQVLTVTDPLGNRTTNAYDSHGNLLSVTSPAPDANTSPSVTQFAYDNKGEMIQMTDPLGRITMLTYTAAGMVASITDPLQNVTSYEYDLRGNRTAVIDATQQRTEFSYDAGDRLVGIKYPDKTTSSFTYDLRGRRTSATDQNGKTTTYTYDDADRLIAVTDAAQNSTRYAYDAENNLLSITDAGGNTTSFSYDANRRLTQTAFPSSFTESYGYDSLGNLTSKTDRKGQTITYLYDALNRLTHKGYPGSTGVDYIYDLVGKVRQVSDPTGTYGFAYDNMGRLVGTTTQYSFLLSKTFTNTYAYDAASNRTGYTDPAGVSRTYSYDVLNRPTALSSTLGGNFGFGYDNLSRRTSLTRPNSVSTTYAYDSLSRLQSMLHQLGGATIDGAEYTYDNAGDRTAKTNRMDGSAEQYGYDAIYQLTQVLKQGSATESYTYDQVGNRLSSIGQALLSHNESNELMSTPTTAYTYDRNGNMLTRTGSSGQSSQTTSYAWDAENRLTSATSASGTVSFKYDPFGRRIQKSSVAGTTNYVYDGANIVAEYDGSGALSARYDQGLGVDEPLAMSRNGALAFYHADALGSVTSMTDAAGSAVAAYTTDTFGNPLQAAGTVANPFRYTGREWDAETNLYYYRARYYDPSIGRFISEDPAGFFGGINKYAYVHNNPLRYVDPKGLWPWDSYFKNKIIQSNTQSDQSIYNMTSTYATDPFLWNQPGATELAQINQLAYQNLIIDTVMTGHSVGDAVKAFPELMGSGLEQIMELLASRRDQYNQQIDQLLQQAANEIHQSMKYGCR